MNVSKVSVKVIEGEVRVHDRMACHWQSRGRSSEL